ncbi:AfsR/SARP family transcriptional regulator [Streptomyces sp. NPDC002523]
MQFKLLGPLSVNTSKGPVEVRGHRMRVLLATLLLNANQTTAAGTLLADCWSHRTPARADNALEAQVKRLRAKLDEWDSDGFGRGRLQTRYRGYLLAVGDRELDLNRFQALRAEGRALLGPDPAAARRAFRNALSLWHGNAFQDLDSSTCQAASVRFELSRIGTREDLMHAELRLGRHRYIIDELQELVLLHPLQESFYDHLMVALCRSGLVGESLSTYRKARRVFMSELGLEPPPLLRRRMEMILRNDPSVFSVPAGLDGDRPMTTTRRSSTGLDSL